MWVEQEMQDRFGSKRRAKEEILARYASFIYMGRGQYGFAAAAEYYFGRPLVTLSGEDADTAALLAGIAKAPRDYAPDAHDPARVVRRRNQTLALMEANGSISHDTMTRAAQRALPVAPRGDEMLQAPAVVAHVLEALDDGWTDLSVDDLLEGRIQVYATVDAQVQRVVNEALEHGLARYEERRPSAKGLLQGAVVVLRNGDAQRSRRGGRPSVLQRPARCVQRLQPGHDVAATARIGDETACLPRGLSRADVRPRHHGSRRTHWHSDGGGPGHEMDLELRSPVQGRDAAPAGARGIQECRRGVDCGADRDRERLADVPESRRPDAAAVVSGDRVWVRPK